MEGRRKDRRREGMFNLGGVGKWIDARETGKR